MNRRSALKQAALFAGGIALLPSCNFGPERVAVALNNLQIDSDHQDLLATIVETIIPYDKASGGAISDLHHFVLIMVDDCELKADQDKFINGLQGIKTFVNAHMGKSFPEKNQEKNEEVLTEIFALDDAQEASMPGLKDVKTFLSMSKGYSIQGYMASEYIMTKKFPYKLVPGVYQTCVSTEGLTVM